MLVKDQTNKSENGIYLAKDGASWTRATDFDSGANVTPNAFTFVEEGTVNADSGWVLTTNGTINIGSTNLEFLQFSGAGNITAGDGLSKDGNTLEVTVDDSSIEINSDTLRVKASGITDTMLAGFISDSKLFTITTANKVSLTSLDIDGGTDIEADLDDADLIIIDDGAGGTNRKCAMSRVKTYIKASTDVSLVSVTDNYLSISGQEITSGTVPVSLGGTGLTNYTSGDILYASSENQLSKLPKGSANTVLGINNLGAISYGSVTNAMLAGSIENSKLSNNSITINSTSVALGGSITVSGSGIISSLNNKSENRLVTIGTTTTELDGEENLTFDGSILSVTGSQTISGTATSDATPILSLINSEDHADSDVAMKFVASNKSYTMGIRGSNDNFEIAYKADTDVDLDDTNLIQLTSAGNLTVAGDLTISGGNVTNGTATLNAGALSGVTTIGCGAITSSSTINGMHLKCNGTNFTNSLILSPVSISTAPTSESPHNVGIGHSALNSLRTGNNNIGMGYQSLLSVTEGIHNIAIGDRSLTSLIGETDYPPNGQYNIGIGQLTLANTTSGNNNLCLGRFSGQNFTAGYNNVGIGYASMAGGSGATNPSDNVAIGHKSLYGITSANSNVCIGRQSSELITTGIHNVCFGRQSGYNITTGGYNVAIGSKAMANDLDINTTAITSTVGYNIGIGREAMRFISTGTNNIALGFQTLLEAKEAGHNIAIGYQSMMSEGTGTTTSATQHNIGMGYRTLWKITSGDHNICIGRQCCEDITTGSNNVCIGIGAEPSNPGATNQIVIGYSATGKLNPGTNNHSNTAAIGNADIAKVYFGGGAAVIYANANINSSDNRIKDNIVDIDDSVALQQVRDIPCRNYTYKDTNRRGTDSTPGFIAQEVESVYPLAVSTYTECIPNEYRLLNDYTLVETTIVINPTEPVIESTYTEPEPEPEYYWKLTVNDLTDFSTTNRYRFKFSDETTFDYNNGMNNKVFLECIDGEPNSFLVTKQWTHIFLYGKEVSDFKKIDKAKIFTLHHSAIQQLDKTQTAEQLKIVTLESKVATLESELAAIKTHLGL